MDEDEEEETADRRGGRALAGGEASGKVETRSSPNPGSAGGS
jgi:hypothetical protein